MSLQTRPRALTPHLASYFAIFASAVTGLVILVLMLEHMGLDRWQSFALMLAAPLAAYLLIGVLGYALSAHDFFVAGRTVPGAFGGLANTMNVLGAAGIMSLTGTFFFLGFDALAYLAGVCAGLLISAALIAPYIRKDGSFTLAGFLGRRFESRLLRVLAGISLTLPTLLLLVAELKIGSALAAGRLGVEPATVTAGLALVACLTVIVGGMRSLTWTSVAQGIVVLLALLAPVTIVALMLTNVPLPQLTYGMIAGEMQRLEDAAGIAARSAAPMMLTLPGQAPETIVKPFMQPFAAAGHTSFLLLMLTVAFGVASLPTLAARASTGASVFETRRIAGWTLVIAALVLLTLPAIAAFARFIVLGELDAGAAGKAPGWLETLAGLGVAAYDPGASPLTTSSVRFGRDAIVLLLPIVAGLPDAVVDLVLLGMLSAVLAGAAAQILALATLWTEDVIFAWSEPGSRELVRVSTARGLTLLAASLGAFLATSVHADPLTLFNWSLALAASQVFPILIMSVWWKRISKWGAMAGLLAGATTALLHILLTMAGSIAPIFGLNGSLSAVLGVPIGATVAILVSLVTPRPEKRIVELVRDIRVPGGETVYDREVRLAKMAQKAVS